MLGTAGLPHVLKRSYTTAALPYVVSGMVAAGGLAAALSTADGLLLTISYALSHDLYYKVLQRNASAIRRVTVSKVLLLVVALGARQPLRRGSRDGGRARGRGGLHGAQRPARRPDPRPGEAAAVAVTAPAILVGFPLPYPGLTLRGGFHPTCGAGRTLETTRRFNASL